MTSDDDRTPRDDVLGLVARAVEGDQDALAEVLAHVQDPVYRLALRMTGRVADAEDATQEILIRIMTRLSMFRGEASLVTWAYRIAMNHLLNLRRRPAEMPTFGTYRQDLLNGLQTPAYTGPDSGLLAEEIRLLCTQALLQCLDGAGRAAYVVGEILGLPGDEAAWVLAISPPAYRKRLERARRQVRRALQDRCGLLDAPAPCRCDKRITYAIDKGRIASTGPVLATHPTGAKHDAQTVTAAAALEQLRDVGELLRAHPDYAAPEARTKAVLALVRSTRYKNLLPDQAP
ncbi:RNA polymerase sigma factor [Actinomadura violacea]|uniref:RNA polymerase sigma factor n=1 Tax=Actinomadura violacea TaxID=2819934 RepID=A0ABS3S1I3_9ACTN|nr:RNA polymerase sigma factor [Actinomadura violacea]MBO2462398.1 RNA polymerase sigma factor [Actinomadura violacea]